MLNQEILLMLSKNTFHHSNKFFLRTNYLFASFVWLTSTIEGFQPFWFSQKLATIIFMDFVGVRQQINHDFFFDLLVFPNKNIISDYKLNCGCYFALVLLYCTLLQEWL